MILGLPTLSFWLLLGIPAIILLVIAMNILENPISIAN